MIICKTCKQCGGWIQMSPGESRKVGEIKINPFPKKSDEIDGHLCDCSKKGNDKKE